MDTGDILRLIGGPAVGGMGLLGLGYYALKMAIPQFAKARLDANSLGVADKLIASLQDQIKNQAEDHRNALNRADETVKAERERADATRKALDETRAALFSVEEKLSALTNTNIKFTGTIDELTHTIDDLKSTNARLVGKVEALETENGKLAATIDLMRGQMSNIRGGNHAI